ncbi:winged helix-turn-helix domain-containing protein [Rhizobium rhizogenes]|uniref:winged helix-turn-helix domain-containing protein n=1 Tax=Rhizobium rhizogenes TaxID=359 RepID=UPI0022C88834|nr:winged helix-turn-helix domain-containing protein [Rhizobium rhizogenes]MCZ7488521.1 winged helix-turn-helix domain-containing protein [Rhizobium rhizogenes]
MNMHDVSKLDIEKFRKVHSLISKGATAGERSAAKARAEAMAAKAGMTLSQVVSKLDGSAAAKSANFFDGFDNWMEEREPGYKAREAVKKAEKAAADAIRRKEVLAKYGTEQALFARNERERLLAAAVHDMAQWRDWTDDDGTIYTYADKIDGKMDFWTRRDLTERVYAAVLNAYPVPAALGGVLAEYLDWQALQRERDLFSGGEWNHHREVEARIAVLKDELDNRPAASWDDMDARIGWWEEVLFWDFTPSLEEERLRKERIAADLQFLRGYNTPAGVQVGQPEKATASEFRNQSRSNADIRAAVLSMLDTNPELSDREISRRVGVSPQTVGNWRKRGLA